MRKGKTEKQKTFSSSSVQVLHVLTSLLSPSICPLSPSLYLLQMLTSPLPYQLVCQESEIKIKCLDFVLKCGFQHFHGTLSFP